MHDAILRLARINSHPRDERVTFDEGKHQYTVDGRVVVGSVSSLWGSCFEVFNADETAKRCYPKWARAAQEGDRASDADDWFYTDRFVRLVEGGTEADARLSGAVTVSAQPGRGYSRLLQHLWKKGWCRERCITGIVSLWSELGKAASERGTYVHLQCELHCNGESFDEEATEVQQYISFRKTFPNLTPYRTEWSVFAKTGMYIVAGQIDAVFKDADGEYHMIDYKCCAHALSSNNPFGKKGTGAFREVPDTPWGHYACQQNIYRYILECHYGIRLKSAQLLRVHSSIAEFELVDVPDLRSSVAELFDHLRETTHIPNFQESHIQKFRRKTRILTSIVRLLFYTRNKTVEKMSASEAMHIKDAAGKLKVQIQVADVRKRADSKGKGCVHHLKSTDGTTTGPIFLQMPRAMTFGVRPNMSNNGPVPKYHLTLKYTQPGGVVGPLRAIHEQIKQAIGDEFHTVLPKTTRVILGRLNKKNKQIPLDLFDKDWMSDKFSTVRDIFFDEAREKVDEICVFGGSEEDFEMHVGKSKMVTFVPAKTGKDGKTYDKAWTVNVSCPIKMKRGGGVEFHPSEDGELHSPARPVFNFCVHESPENNMKNVTVVNNEEILQRLAPVDGAPFSREGVAVVCLPYFHVRDDESAISVNVSLEHFHTLLRDQGSVLGKRAFVVVHDEDTPQGSDIHSRDEGDVVSEREEEGEDDDEEDYD